MTETAEKWLIGCSTMLFVVGLLVVTLVGAVFVLGVIMMSFQRALGVVGPVVLVVSFIVFSWAKVKLRERRPKAKRKPKNKRFAAE